MKQGRLRGGVDLPGVNRKHTTTWVFLVCLSASVVFVVSFAVEEGAEHVLSSLDEGHAVLGFHSLYPFLHEADLARIVEKAQRFTCRANNISCVT